MRALVLVLAVLLSACGPSLARRPNGPLCSPDIVTLSRGDRDATAFGYQTAMDAVVDTFGHEPPAMCGVSITVWPIESETLLEVACQDADAAACVNVNPGDGRYLIRVLAHEPEHLRHEFLHVLFSELGVHEKDHHPLMNLADVYYYPHGSNLDAK